MEDYEELGLNKFFAKPSTVFETLADNDFDAFVDNISANKINRGVAQTPNLTVDWDVGELSKYEGKALRLKVGKFDDGTYGLRVYDSSGNTIVNQTG